MTNYSARILALCFLVAASPIPQTNRVSNKPTIDIGIELRLGMSRDTVMSKLTEMGTYSVTKIQVPNTDQWIIKEKSNAAIVLGLLAFQERKLFHASREWTHGDEDTYAFAKALWGAMSQMQRDGQQSCFFDVPTTTSPQMEASSIRFYCGPPAPEIAKRIEIDIVNDLTGVAQGRSASISEVLSSDPRYLWYSGKSGSEKKR